MLFRKIGVILISILASSGILVSTVLFFYSHTLLMQNKNLQSKLTAYLETDSRISNMEKSLITVYDLSKYEAHYYSIIFDDFSKQYQIPWEAFPALVRVETNFNPTLLSKERAKGMVQVLEGTGKIMAQKLEITFNEATLWNDLLNMIIGFSYFGEGFSEKKDSLPLDQALKHAMRRYVGGPGYSKVNPTAQIYVGEYKNTLWQEYVKLSYIYKGVLYDQYMQTHKDPEVPFFTALMITPMEKVYSSLSNVHFVSSATAKPLILAEQPK